MDKLKLGYNTQGVSCWFWIIVISIVYILRDIVGMHVPELVFVALCTLSFFLTNFEDNFCLMVFYTALSIPLNEIRLVYLIMFFLKNRQKVNIIKNGFQIVLLLLLQLLNMIAYSQMGLSQLFYTYVVFSIAIIVPLLWSVSSFSSDIYVRALKCFILSSLLVGIVTIALTVRLYGWTVLLSGTNSLGENLESLSSMGMVTTNNRNTIGITAAVSLAAAMILWVNKKSTVFESSIVILSSGIILFLTRSRTAFILVGITIVYWILFISRKEGEKKRSIIVILFLIAAVFAVYRYLPSIWYGVVDRFFGQTDITNNRNTINSAYLTEWSKNPMCILFGYGVYSYADVVNYGSPHNMIVDILISWGLVGGILLFGWLKNCLKKTLINIPKQYYPYALLLPILYFISRQGGQYLTVPTCHLRFVFVIICMSMFRTKQSSNLKNDISDNKKMSKDFD